MAQSLPQPDDGPEPFVAWLRELRGDFREELPPTVNAATPVPPAGPFPWATDPHLRGGVAGWHLSLTLRQLAAVLRGRQA